MAKTEHFSAAQLERRKANLSRRQRRDRLWTIILIVIAVTFFVTIIAIQIIHHL